MAIVNTVEHSPSSRRMAGIALAPAGSGLIETGHGCEGLGQVTVGQPQIVVDDIDMPVINGLERIAHLHRRPSMLGVPIVFLPIGSDDAVKQQARAAGATGRITKSFKPEQRLAVISTLVRT